MARLDELENNLKPSFFSGSGFIGDDERSIKEIISKDLKLLEENNIDKKELLQLLRHAFEKVESRLGEEVELADDLYGKYFESKGKIPSPIKGEGVFDKGEVDIENKKTEEKIIITNLGLHLIEEYDFFQGEGSRYRIDPVKAYNMLKDIRD